ncbi:shikimate dehydrogenase [Pedococcus sp. KACC 23699]|uniref:Shikimate dehydrogenase n=1 Tax=Pedococcus sp. KACC 23699 TaxID=3149228 RepID=A0AAU7JTD2_9MICO
MVQGPLGPVLNAAVLGRPVAHSLSPLLHTAGYRALGLDHWAYGAHDLGADDLAAWVRERDDSWRGLSLTMPLKEAALAVAATVSETAQVTGSVNTLVRRADLAWDAHNTDVHGLVAALDHVDHAGAGTVLGSGATARSAAVALAQLGVTRVRIAARNLATTTEIIALLDSLGVRGIPVALQDWALEPGRLVLSTLPPAAGDAASGRLGAGDDLSGATLLDVVYAQWPTPLAVAATRAGADVVSGLEMLVHQAARQFELFTGEIAPVDVMLAAGRAALGR